MREALTDDERYVVFASTLAQVENIHTCAWTLTDEQNEVATSLLERLEASFDPSPLSQALVMSLHVTVHDIDHPILSPEQQQALETLHAELSAEFGHTPEYQESA